MKYALVEGERREAYPKLKGTCPNCESEVVAKCGTQRIWHWSHNGKLECDHWWEPETEWHRAWKALFPQNWQEVGHVADDGERHVADVKNDAGVVIELQHSPISSEERRSRENFYEKMIWVVDGLRYKRDLSAFREALSDGIIVKDNPLCVKPLGVDADKALFKRWAPQQRPVFIDFGEKEFNVSNFKAPGDILWQLLLDMKTNEVVISAVTRDSFIQYCLNNAPLKHLQVFRQKPQSTRVRPNYRRLTRRTARF